MSRLVLLITPALGEGGGIASASKVMADTWPPTGDQLRVIETGGANPRQWFAALREARALMDSGQVSAVWIQTASRGSALRKSAFMAAARRAGVPYFVHIHGGGFPAFLDGLPAPARKMLGGLLRDAASVVVLGARAGQAVADRVGLDSAHLVELPNAATMAPGEVEDVAEGATKMLYVGPITEAKGVPALLAACKDLHDLPDWHLSLVGPGEPRKVYEWVRAVDVTGSRVEAWGAQPNDRVRAMMNASDVVVIPSLVENLPMVLLEAMAAGLPVVATDVGVVSDVVDESTGILVPPGDAGTLSLALRSLLTDPDRRRAMGDAARAKWQDRYTADTYGSRVQAVAQAPQP